MSAVPRRPAARRTGRPGRPRVVVKGLALFGAVVTRSRQAGERRG
ncbi:hypothetical protein AB0A60_20690 [Streptomyces sp. NPDC046275]